MLRCFALAVRFYITREGHGLWRAGYGREAADVHKLCEGRISVEAYTELGRWVSIGLHADLPAQEPREGTWHYEGQDQPVIPRHKGRRRRWLAGRVPGLNVQDQLCQAPVAREGLCARLC
jgi:hypothetical protein